MHTKTIEGIVGASNNVNMMKVPMRVYMEARRKNDTAKMERAMGYANEFAGKAAEYKSKAEEGMKEDAKEIKEKEQLEREQAIQKSRDEKKQLQAETEKSQNPGADILQTLEEDYILPEHLVASDAFNPPKANPDLVKPTVTYTKTGKASTAQQDSNISISL